MSKKKAYGMLLFTLFTFILLGIVIGVELGSDSGKTENRNTSEITGNPGMNDNKGSDEAPPGDVTQEDGSEENNASGNTAEESKDVVMVFSGDIYMSDYVLGKYEKEGINGVLSEDLQAEFRDSDIAMVNEEFPFSSRGKAMENKQFTFRVDPKWVRILSDMQVDIVTLANNHTLDFGIEGLTDTLDALSASDIKYVGAGNNLEEAKETRYFNIHDKTIAVLGASRVIPVPGWNAESDKPGLFTTYDPTALLEEIKAAKEQSDFVVVYVHWGIERDTKPKEYQRGLAKQYIDAGADLVVGSHPHVLQGIEYYKDKPIVYSLGNFMFYNTIDSTALLKATFTDEDGVRLQLIPCRANNALTYVVDDKAARAEFYRYITDISFDAVFDENGLTAQK